MEASQKIVEHIKSYEDWRGKLLEQLRETINQTAPDLVEDFKWNVPVWTSNGLVCAISAFKDHVKINFFKGAFLIDSKGLFNSGLDSKEHRSINFAQDDKLDLGAIQDFIQQAIAFNKKGQK